MKKYVAEYVLDAEKQICELPKNEQKKLFRAVALFEIMGSEAKNSKNLENDLFEIKVDKIRAYFKYIKNKIIIIGIVVLKKTQKAPKRFIKQANSNIEKYLKNKEGIENDDK